MVEKLSSIGEISVMVSGIEALQDVGGMLSVCKNARVYLYMGWKKILVKASRNIVMMKG